MTQTLDSPASMQSAAQVPGQPQYIITDEDRKRQHLIADAWKAYNGMLDKPLERMPGQPDDNVMSNRCQPIVDKGIDFLFGKEVDISLDEGAPKKAQQFLDDVWGDKEQRLPLLQRWGMNGAMSGQAYLRIVPDNKGHYRLVGVDPSTVFVQTAPQDCETVLRFAIEYGCEEYRNGRPVKVFYREEISRIDPDGDASQMMPDDDDTWQIQHWTQVAQNNFQPKNTGWTPAGPPILWPYPFAPLFSNQNLPKPNDFWGTADITPDLVEVNKALNLVQSNISRVNKLYGQPIVYATGVSESSLDIRPGRITVLPPTPESKMGAVPITSDLTNALKFSDNLRSDMDEQSAVPGVATGRIASIPSGRMSGIAIELLFMPLLTKTEKKRCLYGKTIIDVCKALLTLNNMPSDFDITISWQYPLPVNDLEDVQAAVMKLQAGVSKTEIMRELGYDPDEQFALSQTEQEQQQQQMAQQQAMMSAPAQPGQQQAGQSAQQQQSPMMGGQK